jgi:hypothetical protein
MTQRAGCSGSERHGARINFALLTLAVTSFSAMILRRTAAAAATRAISLQRPLTTTSLQLASRHTRSRPPVRVTRRPTASTSPTEAPAPSKAAEEAPRERSLTPALPLVSRLPVYVPHDSAGVLDSSQGPWLDSLRTLLSVPALVVARQLEMMSILVGYEQANRYQLLSPEGEVLGYLLEEELGIGSAIKRQVLRTHRPFKATVLDKEGRVLLIVSRESDFGADHRRRRLTSLHHTDPSTLRLDQLSNLRLHTTRLGRPHHHFQLHLDLSHPRRAHPSRTSPRRQDYRRDATDLASLQATI